MTEAQWRKLQLRLRGLLRQHKMINMIIWEDLDGTIRVQVTENKTETIAGGEPPRRTSI